MSKVYSFRLDENNPREAQAIEAIDAWVKRGFSLRQLITDVFTTTNSASVHYLDEQLATILRLLQALLDYSPQVRINKKANTGLSEAFVGSLAQVVKPGIEISE